MRALCIPIALLSTILISSISAGYYTRQCTAEWIGMLEQCEDFLHEEQWERAHERLLATHSGWEQHAAALHMILEHQALDDVELLFSGAFAACRDHNSSDLRILLHQLRKQLTSLAETQETNLKNIL